MLQCKIISKHRDIHFASFIDDMCRYTLEKLPSMGKVSAVNMAVYISVATALSTAALPTIAARCTFCALHLAIRPTISPSIGAPA